MKREITLGNWIGALMCGAVVGTLTVSASPALSQVATAPAIGKRAPEISVTGVDGSGTKLSALRGKVVLIDFWATWCPPCRKGLPETQALYKKYGKKGLAVLTITDEPKDTVKPFLKTNELTFPAYLDKSSATNQAYGIQAIPTVAIIDKNGKLSALFVGLQDKSTIIAALKKAGLKT